MSNAINKEKETVLDKGYWIEIRCDMYICPKCKHIYTDLSCEKDGMNFCPNCGVKLKVKNQ